VGSNPTLAALEYRASVGGNGSELSATSRFDLRPRPAVASFAAAAVATALGCALLVLYGMRGGGVVLIVVGIALLIFGIALAASALLYATRLHTVVELDAESITIRRGSRRRSLQLTEIRNVSLDGSRLTLHARPGIEDAVVFNPRTATDPSFTLLMAALSQRLDASRGYGTP
jgi:hypothetical protein